MTEPSRTGVTRGVIRLDEDGARGRSLARRGRAGPQGGHHDRSDGGEGTT